MTTHHTTWDVTLEVEIEQTAKGRQPDYTPGSADPGAPDEYEVRWIRMGDAKFTRAAFCEMFGEAGRGLVRDIEASYEP